MANLKRKVRSLQWKNSKACIAILVLGILACFSLAVAARFYAFEPVQVHDSSMYPRHKDRDYLWMCKLSQCLEKVKYNESVWATLRNGESVVRKVIGLPGDRLDFSDRGRVKTPHGKFRWKDESAFIQSRQLHIPRKGDTLHLDRLNDIEEDFFVNLLHESGQKFYVKTTLWQGEREIGVEALGATKLGNRQVSLQEIDFLPWQDRFLLEEQVFHSEPGDSPIQMRREFYSEEDSTQITEFVVPEDCYFLACEKGAFCLDSREVGYFTQSHLRGRYVKEPRIAINYVKRLVSKLLIVPKKVKKMAQDETAPEKTPNKVAPEETKKAPEGANPDNHAKP